MKKLLLALGLAKQSDLQSAENDRDYYAHRVAEWRTAAESLQRANVELIDEQNVLKQKIDAQAATIASLDNELNGSRQEFRRVSLQLAAKCDEAAQLRRDLDYARSDKQASLPLAAVDQKAPKVPDGDPMITVRRYLARNAGIQDPARGLLLKISNLAKKIAQSRDLQIGRKRGASYSKEQNCHTYPASVIAEAYRGAV